MASDRRRLESWILLALCMASPRVALGASADGPPAQTAQPLAPVAEALGIPVAQKITLAGALVYARAHQPTVRAALARVQEEMANAQVPRAQDYPLVGATAQFLEGTANNTTASYLNTPFVELPRIGATPGTNPGSASFRPYASTVAAIGACSRDLRLRADRRRVRGGRRAGDGGRSTRPRRSTLDIDLNVEEAFFAVHAAEAILKASEDAYRRGRCVAP